MYAGILKFINFTIDIIDDNNNSNLFPLINGTLTGGLQMAWNQPEDSNASMQLF